MRLWTFKRPFQHNGNDYQVKYFFSFTTYTSQLFCNGTLVDETTHLFDGDFKVVEHKFKPDNQTQAISVSVGYYNWFNVGIQVKAFNENAENTEANEGVQNSELIYESHPGKNIHFATAKLEKFNSKLNSSELDNKRKAQSENWKKNKPSILADIAIGVAFYVVAKVTGDLTTAAFTSISLGLGLVVVQRFVKVDLLGGFAVFGTIMLLISALLSITFESEFLVQIKGTIMGLLSASVLLADGIFNKGSYFGARFERYINSPIQHKYFVLGLALIGLCIAGVNYSVASQLTEEQWLTYDTFIETPLYFVLFFILIWRAGKASKTQDKK